MNELISDVKILRYFKSDLDGMLYGDFYVMTKEGSYYVFLNANKIKLISHYQGSIDFGVCANNPTEKFEEEFWDKVGDPDE